MIAIDQLCYRSKLRYHNAGEKFAFTILTLLFCVVSRSVVIAGIVLVTTGILTIYKGGIPFFRYLKFLTVPLAFLILSTAAIVLNVSKTPSRSLRSFHWKLVFDRQQSFLIICGSIDLDCTGKCLLSVLFFVQYSYHRFYPCIAETALPPLNHRTHASDLSIYFYTYGDILGNHNRPELSSGQQGFHHLMQILRLHGLSSPNPGSQKIQSSLRCHGIPLL